MKFPLLKINKSKYALRVPLSIEILWIRYYGPHTQ